MKWIWSSSSSWRLKQKQKYKELRYRSQERIVDLDELAFSSRLITVTGMYNCSCEWDVMNWNWNWKWELEFVGHKNVIVCVGVWIHTTLQGSRSRSRCSPRCSLLLPFRSHLPRPHSRQVSTFSFSPSIQMFPFITYFQHLYLFIYFIKLTFINIKCCCHH